MSRSLPVVLAVSLLSFAVAVPAHAYLITVNFNADGNLGSFTYDSSIVPNGGSLGGYNDNVDYCTSLSVTFLGTTYTESTAGVNYLTFDLNGSLTGWQMYGDLNGPNMTQFGPDFVMLAEIPGYDAWNATDAAGQFLVGTNISWSTTTSGAPEPASLALVGMGLLGAMAGRRKERRS